MSFSDFGRSRPQSTAPQSSGSGGGVMPMGQSGLNQISECLLQYQRHVGILEKIVHSLTTGNNNNNNGRRVNREELESQYQAQVDVITQWGDKVHALIQDQNRKQPNSGHNNAQIKSTLDKLDRDVQRVQKQATALQNAVTRMREQQLQLRGTTYDYNKQDGGNAAYEEYKQQMQMQLQEDRLAEQIMREREEEIRNINRGMHQVNEIYKDLAHIVESQQEQVDNIESQMEESRNNAESGLTQIEKANDKFGSSNCIIS